MVTPEPAPLVSATVAPLSSISAHAPKSRFEPGLTGYVPFFTSHTLLALQVHSVLAGVGGSVVVVELVVVVTTTLVVVVWAPTRRAHSAARRTTMLAVRMGRTVVEQALCPQRDGQNGAI